MNIASTPLQIFIMTLMPIYQYYSISLILGRPAPVIVANRSHQDIGITTYTFAGKWLKCFATFIP